MRNPPILVAVLGFFAALAGFGFLFFGLRLIGFDWFGALGDIPALERVGLWGWLAVATGIVWLLVAVGLWGLQPWARTFAMIIAGFALFEAALAFFQFPGTGIGFAMAIMPVFILWYLRSKAVKAAFGVEAPVAVAPRQPVRGSGRRRGSTRGGRGVRGVRDRLLRHQPAAAPGRWPLRRGPRRARVGPEDGCRRRRGHRAGLRREARRDRDQDDR